MSKFSFSLASMQDDAALRQRMAKDIMQGNIAVSFRREPSYFMGSQVQGERSQVIKCVENATGKIVGMGARSVSRAWINGIPQDLGYLADLRGDPEYRGGTLLARGYGYLRQLHVADPVDLYYSLILEGNQVALDSLTAGRAGLPRYEPMGRILTPAIHLDLPRRRVKQSGLKIQTPKREQLPWIFQFINDEYQSKQFAPKYGVKDWHTPRMQGLELQDILVATRGNDIVGVIAAWDQQSFRQTVIESYSRELKMVRPFYNLLSRLTPLKPLPAPGQVVPYFYLALCAIKDDSETVFRLLLSHLYQQRRNGLWHYFIAGLHEMNPLAKVLQEYRQIPAAGHLFAVSYADAPQQITPLDERIPHIEIAAV